MQATRGMRYRVARPFAVGAMLMTAAVSLLPVVGRTPDGGGALLLVTLFALIPLIAIVGAVLAGWAAVRARGGTAGDGALVGLVVGVGALLGAVVGLTALGWIAGDYRQVQEFVRNSEPHHDARLPYGWIAPLGAISGALIGVLSGLISLVMATLAGLVTAAPRGTRRRTVVPAPVY